MSDTGDSRAINLEELSFEQALESLERIVEELESGKIGLDYALAQYEVGVRLVRRCRSILEHAEKRIRMLLQDENGEAQLEEFEPESGEEGAESTDASSKRRPRSRRGKGGSAGGEDHRRLLGDEE